MTTPAKFANAMLALLFAGAISMSSMAAADDTTRGEILGHVCLTCHAEAAFGNNDSSLRAPRLGGQKATYLVAALKRYRDGSRAEPTMAAVVSAMNSHDMQEVIAYLEGLDASKATTGGRARARPVAARSCAGCHGENGIGLSPTWPTLAGQYEDYLVYVLNQYRDGTRQDPVMTPAVARLTDADVRVLAQYYSSLDGLETPNAE